MQTYQYPKNHNQSGHIGSKHVPSLYAEAGGVEDAMHRVHAPNKSEHAVQNQKGLIETTPLRRYCHASLRCSAYFWRCRFVISLIAANISALCGYAYLLTASITVAYAMTKKVDPCSEMGTDYHRPFFWTTGLEISHKIY